MKLLERALAYRATGCDSPLVVDQILIILMANTPKNLFLLRSDWVVSVSSDVNVCREQEQ